jgi:hypothetical protein
VHDQEVSMPYTGDKYQYCKNRMCGKRTKWVRCPNCQGRPPAGTQCGWKCDNGYVCENGVRDKWH